MAAHSLLIILGLHRSGTTLLYQMLAASGCFEVLRAEDVVTWDGRGGRRGQGPSSRSWGAARFGAIGAATRGVDVVRVGPETPEEYGFLLERWGGSTVLRRRDVPMLERLCHDLAGRNGGGRGVLLKNPWDFGRGATLLRMMPSARIVYIHRNPLHVLSSTLRLIVQTVTEPSPYLALLSERYRRFIGSEFPLRAARWVCERRRSWVLRGVIEFTARQVAGYLRSRRTLDRGRCFELSFEELLGAPDPTVRSVLRWMGYENDRGGYAEMLGPHASRLAPEVLAARPRIERQLSCYATVVGYDLARLFESCREDGREMGAQS